MKYLSQSNFAYYSLPILAMTFHIPQQYFLSLATLYLVTLFRFYPSQKTTAPKIACQAANIILLT